MRDFEVRIEKCDTVAEDHDRIRKQLCARDEETIEQRIARVQRVKVQRVIPLEWFSTASTECRDMFIDGHFYGCICLAQSVGEGIGKFVLEVHREGIGKQQWPVKNAKGVKGKKLLKTLKGLKRGTRNGHPMCVLTDKCLDAFTRIEGNDRNDFHHLNRNIPIDLAALEQRAEECVTALYDIESELFGCEFGASLTPNQRQYWRDAEKYTKVFLRAY
jgi:hypothetical protein